MLFTWPFALIVAAFSIEFASQSLSIARGKAEEALEVASWHEMGL